MRKKIIYIFGNPLLPKDSLPLKLAPALQKRFPKIKFVVKDPNENIKPKSGALYLIDTIIARSPEPGAQGWKVLIIEDLDRISLDKIYSSHDLDLGFNLKLLAKIGQLKKVVIFGIPAGMGEKEALEQLSDKFFNLKFEV